MDALLLAVLMTANSQAKGWREVKNARAQWTWGQAVRLDRVVDRVALAEEVEQAGNALLFDRPGAENLEALGDLLGRSIDEAWVFASGRGTWPDWLGVVQGGGRREWDPLLTFTLELYLVDARFTEVLERAGLTRGWTTESIPVFDRDWNAVDSHRALVVDGMISRKEAMTGELRREIAADFAWIEGTRRLVASPDAADALARAKLPGLAVNPVPKPDR